MADEALPGLHDMLANLPRARVPFEQATEATYGRLYDAYDKFKALHAETVAAIGRVRAAHVVHQCDDCGCRICWGMGSVCVGCGKPAPCPTVQALEADDAVPADLVVVSREDLRRYFDSDQSDFAASVEGLKRLWAAAGIETT